MYLFARFLHSRVRAYERCKTCQPVCPDGDVSRTDPVYACRRFGLSIGQIVVFFFVCLSAVYILLSCFHSLAVMSLPSACPIFDYPSCAVVGPMASSDVSQVMSPKPSIGDATFFEDMQYVAMLLHENQCKILDMFEILRCSVLPNKQRTHWHRAHRRRGVISQR